MKLEDSLFFLALGDTEPDAWGRRVIARAHAKRRSELRSQLMNPPRKARREQSVTAVRGLLERLKLTRGDEGRKAADMLAKAGWRTPDALTVFLGLRLGMPVGVGVLVYLAAPMAMRDITPVLRGLAALVGHCRNAAGHICEASLPGVPHGVHCLHQAPHPNQLVLPVAEAEA